MPCLTQDAPVRCACAPIAGGRGCGAQRRGQLDRPRRRRLCGRRARGERHCAEPPCRTGPRASTQIATLSAPACAQAPDDASADDEAVRALLGTQFERGDTEDYVQLKDVAALLEAHHPDCHARLCLKAGTRVPSNEALAAAVSRVLGRKVRNEQVTLAGQVKARGPIRGFRKVCGRPRGYPEATPRLPRGFAPWRRPLTLSVQLSTC